MDQAAPGALARSGTGSPYSKTPLEFCPGHPRLNRPGFCGGPGL